MAPAVFSGYKNDLYKLDFPSPETAPPSSGFWMLTPLTQVSQYLLQEAHNAAAEETGVIKGLKTAGIEIGFLATTFLLGPAEFTLHAILGIAVFAFASIGQTFAYLYSFFDSKDYKNNYECFAMCGLGGFAIMRIVALSIAQAAVSSFTHLAFSGQKIDNHGQGVCCIACQAPTTLEETV